MVENTVNYYLNFLQIFTNYFGEKKESNIFVIIFKLIMKQVRETTLCFLVLLFLFISCTNNHSSFNSKLEVIDSLLFNHEKEEALRQLYLIDESLLNKSDRAYYFLLLNMAEYKNYVEISSDSTISVTVDFYEKHGRKEMYLRSLVAQGCVYEVLGRFDEAVKSYHKAEEIGDVINDKANVAYVKMRLGYLYQSQIIGSTTVALKKFQESLSLYRFIGDKHYQMLCLGEIGNIYRNIDERHDSAVVYMKSAIKLAEDLNDQYELFASLFVLAEYYLIREKDFNMAKWYALKAIAIKDSRIHPRAHYCLASSYLHLGMRDSAIFYVNQAPKNITVADSVVYYNVLSDLYHNKQDLDKCIIYHDSAQFLSDSIIRNNLSDRLLAVEKKYDLQQEELKNAQLMARLRGTWLLLALIMIAAMLLGYVLLRYHHRLVIKEQEQDVLRADIEHSLASLQQMQDQLISYEKQMQDNEAFMRKQMAAQATLSNEHERLSKHIAILETKKQQSDELRSIINHQIESVHQLMAWSYQFDGNKFVDKFREMMSLPGNEDNRASYWANLQTLVNDLHDNVLIRAQMTARGRLSNSEINLLALYCCGFSRTVIMVCMGYRSVGTVYNKIVQITRKLQVDNLNDFISSTNNA